MGLLLTGFGLVMLICAAFKETPLFWRNAGGYPVGLREWTLVAFYPGLGVYLFLLIVSGFTGWKLLRQNSRDGAPLLLACALNCMLLVLIVTVMVWNNVENLLQGYPLHYHGN